MLIYKLYRQTEIVQRGEVVDVVHSSVCEPFKDLGAAKRYVLSNLDPDFAYNYYIQEFVREWDENYPFWAVGETYLCDDLFVNCGGPDTGV